MEATVILGGGIIGLSTAYYLSESQDTPACGIRLVEAAPDFFSSASGYAAGFLAADWFAPHSAALGKLSFSLHERLASQHGGRANWGFSSTVCSDVSFASAPAHNPPDPMSHAAASPKREFWQESQGPPWLFKRPGDRSTVNSTGDTTAQVDPRRLCQFMLDTVRQRGVEVMQPAHAICVSKDLRGELAAVRVATEDGDEVDLPCTRLLIAGGVWTPQIFSSLFPSSTLSIPVGSLAGNSLVVRSPSWGRAKDDRDCYAIFATNAYSPEVNIVAADSFSHSHSRDVNSFAPEVFSRVGGDIYIAGLNDPDLEPPQRPCKSKPDEGGIAILETTVRHMLGVSDEEQLHIVRERLCFRPVTSRGPIVSRVPDNRLGEMTTRGGRKGGVFVAAGHGPWGISLGPGTGKVMSELIEGKATSVNIDELSL